MLGELQLWSYTAYVQALYSSWWLQQMTLLALVTSIYELQTNFLGGFAPGEIRLLMRLSEPAYLGV